MSSVKLSYSCMFLGVRKVQCSADGENLYFSWTSEITTRLENGNSTLLLDKNCNVNITCHVENHVSHIHRSIELHSCSGESVFFFNNNKFSNSSNNDEASALMWLLMRWWVCLFNIMIWQTKNNAAIYEYTGKFYFCSINGNRSWRSHTHFIACWLASSN